MRRLFLVSFMLIAAAAFGFVPSRGHLEADHLVDQVPGYDISWPQCATEHYPPGEVAFTILGLTGGRPFTANPCFLKQYRWAQRFELHPAVYVNVDYPREGRDAPAATGPYGTCQSESEIFEWCRAYNYGYAIGRDAVERARAHGVTPPMWWLDVETGNYWSNDPTYNAQVIRGTIEYFKEQGLPTGLYSTPRQWGIIAGPYTPGLPVWTAGAQGIEMARARCGNAAYAFGGGAIHMVQYYDHNLDTNYLCPGGHPVEHFPKPDLYGRSGPLHRSLSMSGTTLPTWFAIPNISSDSWRRRP